MSTDAAKPPPQANVSIEQVLGVQQHNFWQRIAGAQAFWVTIALIIICLGMSWLEPASFATSENFYNTTRNFSFIGIMALGGTAVISTGGIDLSVGLILGLIAVANGLALDAHYPALPLSRTLKLSNLNSSVLAFMALGGGALSITPNFQLSYPLLFLIV